MSQAPTAEFGRWRKFFWPIHNYELKKIVPMLFMFFFISFVYSILRNAKDALIVTAPGAGAEVIPFLKVLGVVPAAFIFMLIYSKLSNILSKKSLFYVSILPFVAFFVLFIAVLYPAKGALHPYEMGLAWREYLPVGLHGFVASIENWTYSLFYIMAELWGSVVLSLLFWGFANDITRVNEAKRFYALFGLGANLALICVKPFNNWVRTTVASMNVEDPWFYQQIFVIVMMVVASALIMGIYKWMNQAVLTDKRFYDAAEPKRSKKSKPKLSLLESFEFLAKSKWLICIAILVLAYNISINLIEVTWKNQLKLQFPMPHDYNAFMSGYSTALGVTTILMMLFVSSNVLRRFGWTVAALITPVVLLITGTGFFSFIIFPDVFKHVLAYLDATPLYFAVIFGTIQNIMSKAAKYSLFDPTKEMAYIPLDQESKVKGKAAIDVVGARLGKAMGSGTQIGLIGLYGTLAAVTPHIACILFLIIGAWIWAGKNLGKEFKKNEREQQQ